MAKARKKKKAKRAAKNRRSVKARKAVRRKARRSKARKSSSLVDVVKGAATDAAALRSRLAGRNTFED